MDGWRDDGVVDPFVEVVEVEVFRFFAFEGFGARLVDGGVGHGGGWGDEAVDGIVDELGDCVFFDLRGQGSRFGEIEGGDLKAIEEESRAARVKGVGGDAAEDFGDGVLDGRTVFEVWEVEIGLEGAAVAEIGDGWTRGVVVVAEIFLPETDGAAAVSVGEDVSAAGARARVGGF